MLIMQAVPGLLPVDQRNGNQHAPLYHEAIVVAITLWYIVLS